MKVPGLFFCKNENKIHFDDQRELCFHDDHTVEPLKGKFFTETNAYFDGVEYQLWVKGEFDL